MGLTDDPKEGCKNVRRTAWAAGAVVLIALTSNLVSLSTGDTLRQFCSATYGHDWWTVRLSTPYSPGRDVCRQGADPGKEPTLADAHRSDAVLRQYEALVESASSPSTPVLTDASRLETRTSAHGAAYSLVRYSDTVKPRHRSRRYHKHHLNKPVAEPAWDSAVASWYDDAGSTASGYHAYYGVANKSLAFGTQVAFKYNGNVVTATVDDRGPYIGGRDWDLNQNTAQALGFTGVDTVQYAVR